MAGEPHTMIVDDDAEICQLVRQLPLSRSSGTVSGVPESRLSGSSRIIPQFEQVTLDIRQMWTLPFARARALA